VHIAGTNGKGSTAAMLARILSAAGYRTGLYISAFINRFNERMQVDGEPIGDENSRDHIVCASLRGRDGGSADRV
jgi:dihydrofolate synthase/folylpolyglutamate synthase